MRRGPPEYSTLHVPARRSAVAVLAGITYRLPSAVLARYGNRDLNEMAKELDILFQNIVRAAGHN